MEQRPQTIVRHLLRSAAEGEPQAGLRFLDRREREIAALGHADILLRARRFALGLVERGLRPGDRAGIVLPTVPEFADAYFGCQLAGVVPVPLYPPVRLGRIEEYEARTAAMLRAVGARAIVTDTLVRRVLGNVAFRARPELGVLIARDVPASHATGQLPEAGADDLAMIQFSSGTTVEPKPVALTHRQVLANAWAIVDRMEGAGLRSRSGVTWLPLYHDMGLIGCLVLSVLRGTHRLTLLRPEDFLQRPALWLRAISRYRAAISPAPDFAYARCVERIQDDELDGVDLSCWEIALDGAEAVSPETLRAFADRFARWGFRREALTPVYGLSEASLAVTFSDPDRPFVTTVVDRELLATGLAEPPGPGAARFELSSAGRPLPGFAVEVRDDEGRPLPERRVGRIFVRGPSLMRGYFGRQDAPIERGWLDTGDLGFLEGGALFVTGRGKDVIVLRGQNHSPHEVERAIDGVEGVRTGCSAAVGDMSTGRERLILLVEVRSDRADLAGDVQRAVRAGTGLEPNEVVLLAPGTLPRTSSGKVRRQESLRRFLSGELAPPARVTRVFLAGAIGRSALGYLKGAARRLAEAGE